MQILIHRIMYVSIQRSTFYVWNTSMRNPCQGHLQIHASFIILCWMSNASACPAWPGPVNWDQIPTTYEGFQFQAITSIEIEHRQWEPDRQNKCGQQVRFEHRQQTRVGVQVCAFVWLAPQPRLGWSWFTYIYIYILIFMYVHIYNCAFCCICECVAISLYS